MSASLITGVVQTPIREPLQPSSSSSGCSTGNRSFPVKRLNTDEELPLTQPLLKDLFKGVVAHVDVRADCDNRSGVIADELERYGARILKKFSKNTTHLIFKNGSKAVYDKAKLLKIPIVSSMWIDACREQGKLVPESLYPPFCAQLYDSPFAKIKRVRSMQPRPLEENLKLISRQLARKHQRKGDSACNRSFEECLPSYSPSQPLASGIDFFVENSPTVRERLRRKIAEGTPYHKLFDFDDDEDENDTPMSFNIIKKHYFSPNKPPPSSIRKIMAEVEAKDGLDSSDYKASPVLSKRSGSLQSEKTQISKNDPGSSSSPSPKSKANSCPGIENVKKRKRDSTSAEESAALPRKVTRNSSRQAAQMVSPGNKENGLRSVSEVRRVTRSLSTQSPQTQLNGPSAGKKKRKAGKSSTNNSSMDLGSMSSPEGRRFSLRLKTKSSSSSTEGTKQLGGSQQTCRKQLFNHRKKLLPPDSLIVGVTPPEDVRKKPNKQQQHPCFLQENVKKRGRKAALQREEEKLVQSRISLDEFNLDRPKKKPTKEKHEKEKRTIVCTSLHHNEIRQVQRVIKLLGGFTLADIADAATSFVVCGNSRRTLNVMHGIVHGAGLVTYQWVLDSESAGDWLPEDHYAIDPFSNISLVYRNYRRSSQHKFLLFTHFGKFYLSPRSTVPVDDLSRLIVQVGGSLTNNIREADYIIGETRRNSKAASLNPLWILDCIQQCQIVPMNNYLLLCSPKA